MQGKKYKILILLLSSFVMNELHAQKSFFDFGLRDTCYIRDFERQYTLQFSTWYNKFSFYVDPPLISRGTNNLKLSPNLRPQLGFALGLKYLSASFSFASPFDISNTDKYGRTKYFDFTAGYFRGFLGAEMYITNYKGLYQNASNGGIRVRTNAGLFATGLNGFYTFNHKKFSFRSSIKNQELQCKRAGSAVLMGSVGFKSMNADTALIAGDFKTPASATTFNNVFGLRIIHFSLRPGYAYNFIFNGGKFFIAPASFIGAGFSKILISNNQKEIRTNSVDFDLHSKVAVGFNHQKYYWNIYSLYDITLNKLSPQTSTSFNNFFIGFNFGYRFKHLIKKVKWL